mmetsp:Transcript_12846/g.31201  ORF Transcript_12846/g.31201 Transcript_12846/m.31201 type:complete len:120 (+) Transcript_12846:92-451(+)
MASINVTGVQVLDNPAHFNNPLQFEISFECLSAISDGTWQVSSHVPFVPLTPLTTAWTSTGFQRRRGTTVGMRSAVDDPDPRACPPRPPPVVPQTLSGRWCMLAPLRARTMTRSSTPCS